MYAAAYSPFVIKGQTNTDDDSFKGFSFPGKKKGPKLPKPDNKSPMSMMKSKATDDGENSLQGRLKHGAGTGSSVFSK